MQRDSRYFFEMLRFIQQLGTIDSRKCSELNYYFAPYLKFGSKIFLSNALFLTFFYPMFENCFHAASASLFTLLNVKSFFDEIVANLP